MTTDNAPLSANELAKLQLFQGESPDVLDWVLTACPVKSFLAGEVLISSNQVNNSLYLILAGRLQVQLDSHSQQVLAQLEVGQCVGEMSIIEGARPSATVVTDTECRLLVVTDDILWSLINRSHVVARNLLYILSSRLRKANRTIMERLEQQLVYERISKVDALTGLYNRRWLDEMLKRHLQRCHINQESLSLMMLDVDHFKRYNDTYGHL
ncbi:MAG: GGDEF domain-containing protein, partial [Deltaproteobacteria bacterium]|nr:GGDEF domain-containing protein [Deltaproteobacteria bacterium]